MTIRELMQVCKPPVGVRLVNEERYFNGELEVGKLLEEYGDKEIDQIELIYYGVIIHTKG